MKLPLRFQHTVENNAGALIFGVLFVSMLGGLAQVLPSLFIEELAKPTVRPYTALQLAGREIYQRESCGLCHTQQVRPLVAEVRRYGGYSRPGEFAYDRPFLWGSKRTGPDLHRLAGKYTDLWHKLHLINPQSVVPGSIMPSYPWLDKRLLNVSEVQSNMIALRRLGHGYPTEEVVAAGQDLRNKTEMQALIAYLQSLGAQQ